MTLPLARSQARSQADRQGIGMGARGSTILGSEPLQQPSRSGRGQGAVREAARDLFEGMSEERAPCNTAIGRRSRFLHQLSFVLILLPWAGCAAEDALRYRTWWSPLPVRPSLRTGHWPTSRF